MACHSSGPVIATPMHSENDGLAELLRRSIPYVSDDEFDPILYHALSGLHQYIGRHQSRLMSNAFVPTSKEVLGNSSGGHATNSGTNSSCSDNPESSLVKGEPNLFNSATTVAKDDEENLPALAGDDDHENERADALEPAKIVAKEYSTTEDRADGVAFQQTNDPIPRQNVLVQEPTLPSTRTNAATVPATEQDKPDASTQQPKSPIAAVKVEPELDQQVQPPLKGSTMSPPRAKIDCTPSAEVRFEQEKRLTAERHRRNVELQRKLSRAEWKKKDLESKLKFLSQEERKLGLAAGSQQPGTVSFTNAFESLQQTVQQISAIREQIREHEATVVAIKAELLAHKNQQELPECVESTKRIAEEQRRRQEQQQKLENELGARKKAAAEQRRKELEEGRRKAREEQKRLDEEKRRKFLEMEKRKQDLKEQAKAQQRSSGTNFALREKLSTHMSALDAEFASHRKKERVQQVENDAETNQSTNIPSTPSSFEETDPETPPNTCRKTPPMPQKDSRDVEGSSAQIHTNHSDFRFDPCQPNTDPALNDSGSNQSQPSQPASLDRSGKYTKMTESGQEKADDSKMSDLKRRIILQWALQPPHLQYLRPLGELLCTVQNSFPPAHNLPPHSYFDDWKAICEPSDMSEKQLSKAVRRVRFFLHPDKLPHDLTDEHQFVCKLLWDVINDAWEDYKRVKEELGWMQS